MKPFFQSSHTASVLGVIALVTVSDWASKAFAAATLDSAPVGLGPLTLRLSHNSGVAFSLGDRLSTPFVIGATAAVTIVVAVAVFRGLFPSQAAAGLLLGGAVANLGDRIVGGSVVDFLDLGWWPAFNLADVALSAGCVLLVFASWRPEDTQRV